MKEKNKKKVKIPSPEKPNMRWLQGHSQRDETNRDYIDTKTN